MLTLEVALKYGTGIRGFMEHTNSLTEYLAHFSRSPLILISFKPGYGDDVDSNESVPQQP